MTDPEQTYRALTNGGEHKHRTKLVVAVVAAAVAVALVVGINQLMTTSDRAETNHDAIVRSCQVLNEAIVAANAQGQSEVFKLFATYVFNTPARQLALKDALAKDAANPVLPQINCNKVASDPNYHPFASPTKDRKEP